MFLLRQNFKLLPEQLKYVDTLTAILCKSPTAQPNLSNNKGKFHCIRVAPLEVKSHKTFIRNAGSPK